MSKTVLFLGAGASRAFGLPLTGELLPLMVAKLRDGSLFEGQPADQAGLSGFLHTYFPGLSGLNDTDYPLITDILSLVDHTIANGQSLGKSTPVAEMLRFRTLLEKAIFELLDPREQSRREQLMAGAAVLQRFVAWIAREMSHTHFTLISSNYDILLEQRLFDWLRPQYHLPEVIDFGLNWRDPGVEKIHLRPAASLLDVYKLHGSTNWLKCNLCNHLYINTFGTIYHQAFRTAIDDHNSCDCGYGPLSSLIVAPSLAREIHDPNLPQLWTHAHEALRVADRWVMVGYSLPPEDLTIKSMLVRAYHGRKTPPEITVVQYGDAAKARYTCLFEKLDYRNDGLAAFVGL